MYMCVWVKNIFPFAVKIEMCFRVYQRCAGSYDEVKKKKKTMVCASGVNIILSEM